MLTKIWRLLFEPTVWTITHTELLGGYKRSHYSGEWLKISGTQYTLQNQFGDVKFRTVWSDGQEGARF